MGYYDGARDFSVLIGKTISDVSGLEKYAGRVVFNCTDGSVYEMYHDQDCCESVDIEDISGDIDDLIGATVIDAIESSNDDASCTDGACEWTFYNIMTNKGHVFIRWYGTSNGYYGTSVSFYEKKGPDNAEA